ncbi:MAG: sugar ABC transporter substrate-binding protein [Limnochordales bacterium]|nr:sugar ABC transporter substrate-binding protein [Limnochordales bacterium]
MTRWAGRTAGRTVIAIGGLALLLACAVGLADSTGKVVPAASAAAAGKVTLTVMTPEAENPTAIDWYTKVLKPAFEKETGITLNIQITDWNSYLQKIPVLFAGGRGPDVFVVGGELLGTYVNARMVQPLNKWADDWPGLQDYPKPALLDGTIDGNLYTIPYRLDQRTFFYRQDIFEQVGLDPRHPPTTWDELVEMGRKLVVRDEKGEFKRDAINAWPHWSNVAVFILQNGGRFVTADGKQAAFDSPAAIEALQFFVDLSQKHKIAGPWGSPYHGVEAVVSGTAAMQYGGAWVLGQMAATHPKDVDDLGVTLPPKKLNRSGLLYVNKWAMSRTTKNPEAAWKFIEFATRPEMMAQICQINSHLPARVSVIKSFSPWKDDPRWLVFLAAANETVPFPANARKLGEVMSSIEAAVRSTLEGKQALEQAVATEAERATKLLQGR